MKWVCHSRWAELWACCKKCDVHFTVLKSENRGDDDSIASSASSQSGVGSTERWCLGQRRALSIIEHQVDWKIPPPRRQNSSFPCSHFEQLNTTVTLWITLHLGPSLMQLVRPELFLQIFPWEVKTRGVYKEPVIKLLLTELYLVISLYTTGVWAKMHFTWVGVFQEIFHFSKPLKMPSTSHFSVLFAFPTISSSTKITQYLAPSNRHQQINNTHCKISEVSAN